MIARTWDHQLRCTYNPLFVVSQVVGKFVAETKLQTSETRILVHYNPNFSQSHLMIHITKYKIKQIGYDFGYAIRWHDTIDFVFNGDGARHDAYGFIQHVLVEWVTFVHVISEATFLIPIWKRIDKNLNNYYYKTVHRCSDGIENF